MRVALALGTFFVEKMLAATTRFVFTIAAFHTLVSTARRCAAAR